MESLEGGYIVMQSTADVARQVQPSKLNEERKKERKRLVQVQWKSSETGKYKEKRAKQKMRNQTYFK